MTPTAAFCPEHSHLNRVMLWGWCCYSEELGVCLVLSPLGSLVSLFFVHLPTLEQRTHKRCVVSLVSPATVSLFYWQRPASDCVCFIHLSILPVRMLLFWMQTCLVMRHLVISWPHVTVAFTNHSHTDLLFLQTEPVFAYLSAARIPFVSCFFVFSSCGVGTNEHLTLSS